MAISISCSPSKTLETCARIATVVLHDDTPSDKCAYFVKFRFPQGMSDVAQPSLAGLDYPVEPNAAHDFLVKADSPGTITIVSRKVCTEEGEELSSVVDTALKEYEVLECSKANAIIAGFGTGVALATLSLVVTAGTTLGGGIGSVGGPLGIGIGLLIGAVGGGIVYLATRPDCCKQQATVTTQGVRTP